MSITDELREYAAELDTAASRRSDHGFSPVAMKLAAIADRIDEAYQKAEEEWQAKDGQSWLHGYCECHAELMEGNEVIAADLERAGWIRLPKDADGETIRIGERVQIIGNDPSTVSHMSLADDGWRVYVKYDGGIGTGSSKPKCIHHVQPDSWERIIEDAQADGVRYHNDGRPSDFEALVERCKRLAGEDD